MESFRARCAVDEGNWIYGVDLFSAGKETPKKKKIELDFEIFHRITEKFSSVFPRKSSCKNVPLGFKERYEKLGKFEKEWKGEKRNLGLQTGWLFHSGRATKPKLSIPLWCPSRFSPLADVSVKFWFRSRKGIIEK